MADKDEVMSQVASQLVLTKFEATRAYAVQMLEEPMYAEALLRIFSGERPAKKASKNKVKAGNAKDDADGVADAKADATDKSSVEQADAADGALLGMLANNGSVETGILAFSLLKLMPMQTPIQMPTPPTTDNSNCVANSNWNCTYEETEPLCALVKVQRLGHRAPMPTCRPKRTCARKNPLHCLAPNVAVSNTLVLFPLPNVLVPHLPASSF